MKVAYLLGFLMWVLISATHIALLWVDGFDTVSTVIAILGPFFALDHLHDSGICRRNGSK